MKIFKIYKHIGIVFLFATLMLSLLAFKKHSKLKATEKQTIRKASITNTAATPNTVKDKQEIQKLIRNVLIWAEERKTVPNLLPFITNSKDSTVIGFDLSKLKGIDDSLRVTGFFSEEFISNYNQIIQLLNRKMKTREIAPFSTGEIPPFGFSTDADPWCNCQDVPYDKPNAFSLVDVHTIELNNKSGKMYWTWGSLPKDALPGWERITYKFNVIKVSGKWKISYLQGFNIKTAS